MPTIIPTVSRDYRPLWVAIAGLVMAALLLIVMSAQARGPQAEDTFVSAMAPAGRTASELQWNQQEDLRASANVGLPGIY